MRSSAIPRPAIPRRSRGIDDIFNAVIFDNTDASELI